MSNKIGWCKECSVFEGNMCPKLDSNDDYDVGQCCYTCDMKDDCEDSCKKYIRYDLNKSYNGRNYWKCVNFHKDKEEVKKEVVKKDFGYEVMNIKSQIDDIEKKYNGINFKEIVSIYGFISIVKEACLGYEEN